MPINRKYPLEKLLDACRKYPLRPWEHLTFEYVLLGGFNDSPDDARRVVRLLANLRAKVNLIPWNPGDLPYEKPDAKRVAEFRAILADKGVPAFVRDSRGQDVMAACGQLALVGRLATVPPRASPWRLSQQDADRRHHAPGRAFAAIAEEKIGAAGGAEARQEIWRSGTPASARIARFAAIKVEMNARRRQAGGPAASS